MKNYSAARKLVKLYESITIKKINEIVKNFTNIAQGVNQASYALTGRGLYSSCLLCSSLNVDGYYLNRCVDCIYGFRHGCMNNENEDTFYAMNEAKTPKELQLAFRNRAKHIRSIFERDGINFRTLKPIKNV